MDSETSQHFWVNHSTKEISLKDPLSYPPQPPQAAEFSSASTSNSTSTSSGGWLSKGAMEQRLNSGPPVPLPALLPLGASTSISDDEKGDGETGADVCTSANECLGEVRSPDRKKGGGAQRVPLVQSGASNAAQQ